MEIPISSYKITVNGVKAEPDSVLYDGAIVDIEMTEQLPKVIDLLGLMDIDSNSLKSFNITVNQKKAAFMDILNAGDQVEITLEK
jgi:ribosomal 50S subunit-recycling heat shock protein